MELEERREEEMDVEDAVEIEEELAEPSGFKEVVVKACKVEVRVTTVVVVSVEEVWLVTIDAIDIESVEDFDVVDTVLLLVVTEDELLTAIVVNTVEYSVMVEILVAKGDILDVRMDVPEPPRLVVGVEKMEKLVVVIDEEEVVELSVIVVGPNDVEDKEVVSSEESIEAELRVSGVVKDDIVICWAVEDMEDVEIRAVLEDVGKLDDSADEERLVVELASVEMLVPKVVNILMLEKPVVESRTVTVLKDVAETPVVGLVASEVVIMSVVTREPV